mmetsp:Transcript_33856/g.30659  ORF Transcript_33856/g.30659 Transcript_33856/m.30659 type:complete len:119 (+) Transcript_33856:303-659(+)
MYAQIPFIDSIEHIEEDVIIYDFKGLYSRFEETLHKSINSGSKIYIRHLTLEPIDICFTFRSSPGHKMGITATGILSDFGLTLASIDSAKIKLNYLRMPHIFSSKDDIISRIYKHYSK